MSLCKILPVPTITNLAEPSAPIANMALCEYWSPLPELAVVGAHLARSIAFCAVTEHPLHMTIALADVAGDSRLVAPLTLSHANSS